MATAFFAGAALAFVLVGVTADEFSARTAFRFASSCFAIAAFAVIL
jgi:hypothetical protein